MRKIIIYTLIAILMFSTTTYGENFGYAGGVTDGYIYKEVVFITGEPVIVEGKAVSQTRRKGDVENTIITYELKNEDEDMTLKRRINYETSYYDKNDKKQTVATTIVSKFSERITIKGERFNLEDYQFSKSVVYDNRPAVKFYSGNMSYKKTYKYNSNKGTATIEGTADTIVGYEHYWGASETYVINQDIEVKLDDFIVDPDDKTDTEDLKWDGLTTQKMSSTRRKDFSYVRNEPTNISFRGGLLQTEKEENIVQYSYNMPRFDKEGKVYKSKRNKDEENLRMDTAENHKRLVIPTVSDIRGYWAEESIFTLYSIEVFDSPSQYFSPKVPMTRGDFAKAVVRAIDTLNKEEDKATSIRNKREEEEEPVVFDDVKIEDKDYDYIKYVKDKGIMNGVQEGFFAPNKPLNRAEAITILIRTLGLESMAPNPPYKTRFVDDNKIPLWAKDSIYAASEIGLATGYEGYINPGQNISRAEASELIYKYILHIKDHITVDYRERIINNH